MDTDKPSLEPLSAELVSDFFLAQDEENAFADITQLKLHKLMYFAQANYLGATGSRLFDSAIEAFEYGPVVSSIYSTFKRFGRRIIVAESDSTAFNARQEIDTIPRFEYDFLCDIWNHFAGLTTARLVEMSHHDEPWRKNYTPGQMHVRIPDHEIEHWYRSQAPAQNRVAIRFLRGVTDSDLAALEKPLSSDVLRRLGLA